MKNLLLGFLVLAFIHESYSQSLFSKNYKRYSSDFYTGITSFHGDIKGKAGFVLGTKFNWHLTSAFSLYSSLDFATLNGFDQNRNNRFANNSIKLMLGGEAYLFNILRFNAISSRVQPFLGLAFGGVKSKFTKSNISGDDLDELLNDWAFTYQFSGGLKVKLTNSIDVQAKLAIFLTKTDYLDNYKPYVPANKKNDAFNEYTIGITYHFGKTDKSAIIWNDADNTVFGLNTSNIEIKKTDIEVEDKTNESTETKVVSDKPIIIDNATPIYQDVDENEFDCIIKY